MISDIYLNRPHKIPTAEPGGEVESMTDKELLLDDFDNAWRAMAQCYVDSPDESIRIAMNLLVRIKGEIERHFKEREKEQERVSVQEWLDWLQNA